MCVSHIICFFVFGHSGCFYLLGIVNHVAMIMGVQISFFLSWFQLLWINTQKWGWWNIQCCHVFLRNLNTVFHKWLHHQQTTTVPFSPHLHQHLLFSRFFFLHNVYSIRCGYLVVTLTSFSLMMNNVECLFLYLLVTCMSFLEKHVLKSFAHF